MKIIAYGAPAPQGSKGFLGVTASGKGRIAETSTKLRPWRSDVKQAAIDAIVANKHVMWTGVPLAIRGAFSFLRPPSVKYSQRAYPSIAPDLSKLARAVEDALEAAGVYRNDCLIVRALYSKHYCGEDEDALDRPGVLIIIQELVPSQMVEGGPLPPRSKE